MRCFPDEVCVSTTPLPTWAWLRQTPLSARDSDVALLSVLNRRAQIGLRGRYVEPAVLEHELDYLRTER